MFRGVQISFPFSQWGWGINNDSFCMTLSICSLKFFLSFSGHVFWPHTEPFLHFSILFQMANVGHSTHWGLTNMITEKLLFRISIIKPQMRISFLLQWHYTELVWYGDLGWLPGAHQATLSLPLHWHNKKSLKKLYRYR